MDGNDGKKTEWIIKLLCIKYTYIKLVVEKLNYYNSTTNL